MASLLRRAAGAALALTLGACVAETDGTSAPTGSGGSGGAAGAATGGAAGSGGTGAIGGAAGGGGSAGSGAAAGSGGTAGGGGTGGGAPDPCPRVKVTVSAGSTLNVRPTPSTAQSPIGTLASGEIVQVLAQVQGEAVSGNTLWFHIATPTLNGYISAEFAVCTQEVPPPPPAAW